MAPKPDFKVIGGAALAVVALGAGTAIAQSGDDLPQLKLDDAVPVSSIISPGAFNVDVLAVTDADESQSVASPLDSVESQDSVDSVSVESLSVESQSVESASVDSESLESASVESESVESASVDSND